MIPNTSPLTLMASLVAALVLLAGCASTPGGDFSPSDVEQRSRQALSQLIEDNPGARAVSSQAHSTLVFPSIVKGGLVFGGAYGEGALFRKGRVADFYTSFSASWGLQAGAQSFGYVVFLMNAEAARYLETSDGWELGVGPNIVFVDAGLAENLSTSTLRDDAYAFIFDQRGLMAGVTIEGTKVTRIDP